MQAWQSATQLLQLLQDAAAAGEQPAASKSAALVTTLRTNLDQLAATQPSRAVVEQMLQAEVSLRAALKGRAPCMHVGTHQPHKQLADAISVDAVSTMGVRC